MVSIQAFDSDKATILIQKISEKLQPPSEYLDYLNKRAEAIQDFDLKKQYFKEILNIYKTSKMQISLKALPSIAQMITFDDEPIIIEAVDVLSLMLQNNDESINAMIYNGVLIDLLKLCGNKSSEKIIKAAISFLLEITEISEQARFLLYFSGKKETLAKLIMAENKLISTKAIDIIYKVYYPNEDAIRKLFSYEKLSISKETNESKGWINNYSIAIILSKVIESVPDEVERIIELKIIDSLLESLGEHSIIIVNTSLMCLSHMIRSGENKDKSENPFVAACKSSDFFNYLEQLAERNSLAKSLCVQCLKNEEAMSSIYMEDLEMMRKSEKMALKESLQSVDGGEEVEFTVNKEFNLMFRPEDIEGQCSNEKDVEEFEFETSLHNNFGRNNNKKALFNTSNNSINNKDKDCKEANTLKPISICIESPNSTVKFEEKGEASNKTTKNIALTSNNHKFNISLSTLTESPSISIKITDEKLSEKAQTMTENKTLLSENQSIPIEIKPNPKGELSVDEALFYIEIKPCPKNELFLEKSTFTINIKPVLKKEKFCIEKSQSSVAIKPNLKRTKFLIQIQPSSIIIEPTKNKVTNVITSKPALEASPNPKTPEKVEKQVEEVKTPKTSKVSNSATTLASIDSSPKTPNTTSSSPERYRESTYSYSQASTTPSYSYLPSTYSQSSISRSSTYSDYSYTSSSPSWASTFTGSATREWNGNMYRPKKKDGTPDMRYKANYR
ncbi:unnamed protein product [Blepharisma stoltei]|uniref:Uncharacterized protein n=1 Tax=Blepharisma stoltei TaxID=1481888 RepID=A0AAU9JFS5_9CILI|nr:unnamed protein product [Blepharisma stoltei]